MKRVCGWCKKDLGEVGTEEGTTHGICDECLRNYFPEQVTEIKKEGENKDCLNKKQE